jgi:hypothetical protein
MDEILSALQRWYTDHCHGHIVSSEQEERRKSDAWPMNGAGTRA